MKTLFIFILILIFPLFIYSQSIDELMDMDLEDILNIEISSSSKIEQRAIEAPSIISVITSDQISNYNWLSLNSILYKQPGFGPAQDYDRRTVSSRGLFEGWNNNHLLFLVDGIPFNDNLYGTAYTWDNTPLIFAKTIEILRGPGSALYGSNATNGVIQIKTFSPSDLSGTGRVKMSIGNNGGRNYQFITGNRVGYLGFITAFSHFQTDGNEYDSYDGSGEMTVDGQLNQYKTRDERTSDYFWSKIEGYDHYKGLELQYHFQQWTYQTGHGWLWFIPDFDEAMRENRHILSIKYSPKLMENLTSEFLVRYQRHNIDWNTRYYRNHSFADFYPAGMWEYLKTKGEDVFSRFQFTYQFENEISFLTGLETDFFFYNNDDEHYSNIDVDVSWGPFDEANAPYPLGPWFDILGDNMVKNIGFYAQFISGNLLGKKLKATLGGRYDGQFFQYRTDLITKKEKSKDFTRFSPRAALVYMVNKDFSLKAMFGQAFRAPAPTEMFGSHTFSLGSNIEELEPEIITTGEFAFDWIINKNFNFRANIFHTKFENQIAYSTQNNNLSTNIYTSTNQGLETELLFGNKRLTGFINLSYVIRSEEEILDSTITEEDDLTWETPLKANFGFSYILRQLRFSLSGHYHAPVKRRDSDKGIEILPLGVGVALDMDKYRSKEVENWLTIDLNLNYKLTNHLTLGASAVNLFDQEYYLIKNIGFPFDYRQETRRYHIYLSLML